jgi:hypothetical protein
MKKFITATCCCLAFVLQGKAQKLPDVQTQSLAAPTQVRIDGKNTEWDTFAALNKRLDVYYTIANDSKYLYLALKAVDNAVITKLLAGGVTLTLNAKGKKSTDNAQSITFPLVKRNLNAGQGQARSRFGQDRNTLSQEQRDSMQTAQRISLLAGVKEIDVRGFSAITDTLISIYNTYGIKAVAKIDGQNALFYECAIPLSLLNLLPNKAFAYQLKLNGRGAGGGAMVAMRMGGGGNGRGNFGGTMNQQDLWSPTDFWGKYQLHIQP